jgi:hypothetical protein
VNEKTMGGYTTKMKRFLVTAAIALATTTTAQAASNQTTLYASHYWSVTRFAHATGSTIPLCVMRSMASAGITDNAKTNVYIWIKWQGGGIAPFIQLVKGNWHFAQDMQVPFSIKFDKSSYDFSATSKITQECRVFRCAVAGMVFCFDQSMG